MRAGIKQSSTFLLGKLRDGTGQKPAQSCRCQERGRDRRERQEPWDRWGHWGPGPLEPRVRALPGGGARPGRGNSADPQVSLLWAIPSCYPEHVQRNALQGNMFILYLVWDSVCLLFPQQCGFGPDKENLEANLKTHLDQEFTLESLCASTLWFLLCKDKITRTITCLVGKHHVCHVSFKRNVVFATHAYCKTGKIVLTFSKY